MIRLILRLLNIKDYESCKSCETLKQQLTLANAEKKELTETILSLVKPKIFEAPPIHVPAFEKQALTFGQRRSTLEKAHEVRKDIRDRSQFIAKAEDKLPKVNVTNETIEAMESKLELDKEDAS